MDAAAPSWMPPGCRARRRVRGPAPGPARRRARGRALTLTAAALLVLLAVPSCRLGGPRRVVRWVAGCVVPRFDPDGPPNDVRWALERMLSEGLTRERADGQVEGAAAARYEVSADRLTWTFHLRSGLRYTDGHPCTSADIRTAIAAGLARTDHATRAALLAAVRGVRPARSSKTRPALGVETPDPRTVILKLERPDSLLPRVLALPGVSAPWRSRVAGDWTGAVGIGPYRLVGEGAGARLVLARAAAGGGPDSVNVRFVIGGGRLRALLRARDADLMWPVPPELCDASAPAGYRLERSDARPARHLLLVMRADLSPTRKEEVRRALAHGVHAAEIMTTLSRAAVASDELVSGAGRFPLPRYDVTEVASWIEKSGLGPSFHVTLLYDADRTGAAVAPTLQGDWSRTNIDVELEGLRGADFAHASLAGNEQLLLTEWQPLEPGAPFAALALTGGARGGTCGAFRTGWWPPEAAALRASAASGRAAGPAALESALERDLVALPLAGLPWIRLVREGGPAAPFHPHFGPDFSAPTP